jgi:hypothetical protein
MLYLRDMRMTIYWLIEYPKRYFLVRVRHCQLKIAKVDSYYHYY